VLAVFASARGSHLRHFVEVVSMAHSVAVAHNQASALHAQGSSVLASVTAVAGPAVAAPVASLASSHASELVFLRHRHHSMNSFHHPSFASSNHSYLGHHGLQLSRPLA